MKIKVNYYPDGTKNSAEKIITAEQPESLVGGRIQSIVLCVEHDGYELEAYASEEAEGCAGISIDGKSEDKIFYLAAVETPGEYCKDSFAARLYGGNCEYEADGPIALVKSKADGKKNNGTPYSIKDPLTKIVYIDRDCAVGRVWNDPTENLPEHLED